MILEYTLLGGGLAAFGVGYYRQDRRFTAAASVLFLSVAICAFVGAT